MSTQKLAIFDLDGTLFRWQLYYELELTLARTGKLSESHTAQLLDAFHKWQSREAHFHDFEAIALDIYVKTLPTLNTADFEAAVADVLAQSGHKVHHFTRTLAENLKKDGYFLLAISGSQQEIAEPFARKYGFDDCIGWLYERQGDHFTGETLRVTVGNKHEHIRKYVEAHDFSLKDSIAIGDSGGDISMLELVDRPIAFNPNEDLLDASLEKGWEIVVERKNIAYTLQKGTDGHVILAKTDRF
ncbi:MAG TPA: HAD family phosphatase [Candidatus Saccharimonadales bacterium]